jgi:tRNA dimethylallyltransferase
VIAAYFLVGPTACGKSAVAQLLGETGPYDLVSADSMLVYEGMDIGTSKPTREERARVRYYGVDLIAPTEPFSVWSYHAHATDAMARIAEAEREAIVVGGTGLYVKSLTHGLAGATKPNAEARKRWTDYLELRGLDALREALRSRAPRVFDSLQDRDNPRRIIRALERLEAETAATGDARGGGHVWRTRERPPLVGLIAADEELKRRIEDRVAGMYRQGLVEEARRLLDRYGELGETARHAIGYAEAIDRLGGRCSEQEARARTVARTWQLARRQRTWFRHQENVRWVEIGPGMSVGDIAERVRRHWHETGRTPVCV